MNIRACSDAVEIDSLGSELGALGGFDGYKCRAYVTGMCARPSLGEEEG